MKKILMSAVVFLISLNVFAVTFSEDKTSRPIVLTFGAEDLLKVTNQAMIYEFIDDVGTTRIELKFAAGIVLMSYYNSDGYRIFGEIVDSTEITRMLKSVMSARKCPIRFTVLPEEKRFENVHLGCDSMASLDDERTLI